MQVHVCQGVKNVLGRCQESFVVTEYMANLLQNSQE